MKKINPGWRVCALLVGLLVLTGALISCEDITNAVGGIIGPNRRFDILRRYH
ncbi:MAG: hypothetical protein HW384_2277 [Dehalococcoidia bacterium]|nr:hypothetical protein [Dehalococcoidia bacterium]